MKSLNATLLFFLILFSIRGYSQIRVTSAGRVGINNASPSHQFDLNGDFYFKQNGPSMIETQNGSLVHFSNSQLYTSSFMSLGKKDYWWNQLWALSPQFVFHPCFQCDEKNLTQIRAVPSVLDKIIQIRPVSYKIATPESCSALQDENLQLGFIAREVEQFFPEVVQQTEGNKGIKYTEFIPLLVKAVQEQNAMIDSLESRIEKLEHNYYVRETNENDESFRTKENRPEICKLHQNTPNPWNTNTNIYFEIPDWIVDAQLQIHGINGALLKTVKIYQRGAGNTKIGAHEFNPGTYFYSLICDKKIIETKKMLLTD